MTVTIAKTVEQCMITQRQPQFSGNYDAGMRTPGTRWFLHYECHHRDCPSHMLGQRIYPDEPRTVLDEPDAEFPVHVKRIKEPEGKSK